MVGIGTPERWLSSAMRMSASFPWGRGGPVARSSGRGHDADRLAEQRAEVPAAVGRDDVGGGGAEAGVPVAHPALWFEDEDPAGQRVVFVNEDRARQADHELPPEGGGEREPVEGLAAVVQRDQHRPFRSRLMPSGTPGRASRSTVVSPVVRSCSRMRYRFDSAIHSVRPSAGNASPLGKYSSSST